MSMLSEIGDFLEEQGCGTQAKDLFLGSRPDEPDTVLCVYEYPGGTPEYVQDSFDPNQESPQIQVLARAKDYEEASALAHRAWRILARVTNAMFGTTKYRSIRPNNHPGIMGRDSHDRPMIYFNATVEKEVSLV